MKIPTNYADMKELAKENGYNGKQDKNSLTEFIKGLTPIEEIKETPIEEIKETPIEEIKETPIEEVKETPIEEVKETPIEEVKETPIEEVKETPIEEVKETPIEEVKETPIEEVKETPKGKFITNRDIYFKDGLRKKGADITSDEAKLMPKEWYN